MTVLLYTRAEARSSMKDILVRIKRAVLAGHYAFSEKARGEMEADGLTELDVAESILHAVAIYKRLRFQREVGTRKGHRDVLFSRFFQKSAGIGEKERCRKSSPSARLAAATPSKKSGEIGPAR